MGTDWQLKGNTLGTKGKWEKISHTHPHPSPQNSKGKKARHLECMLGLSNWLYEISLHKRVCHHFWPGLIALAKNMLTYCEKCTCNEKNLNWCAKFDVQKREWVEFRNHKPYCQVDGCQEWALQTRPLSVG
jgi:hypothetical protein